MRIFAYSVVRAGEGLDVDLSALAGYEGVGDEAVRAEVFAEFGQGPHAEEPCLESGVLREDACILADG